MDIIFTDITLPNFCARIQPGVRRIKCFTSPFYFSFFFLFFLFRLPSTAAAAAATAAAA